MLMLASKLSEVKKNFQFNKMSKLAILMVLLIVLYKVLFNDQKNDSYT